jgi:ribonucleoside-diphosphate reductase alpha chain
MLQREPRKDERSIPVSGEVSDAITPTPSPRDGMRFSRRFTRPGTHPYDEVEWELRDAVISSGSGEVAFEQRNVEVPKFWSQLASASTRSASS